MRTTHRIVLLVMISLFVGMVVLAGCSSEVTTDNTTPPVQDGSAEPLSPSEEPSSVDAQPTLETICAECHDLERVFLQPTGTDWDEVIATMESEHGADMTEAQKTAIVTLLKSRTPTPEENLVTGTCTECHDLERIYLANPDTDWSVILQKMSSAHGLSMTPEEQQKILDYLTPTI